MPTHNRSDSKHRLDEILMYVLSIMCGPVNTPSPPRCPLDEYEYGHMPAGRLKAFVEQPQGRLVGKRNV